MTGHRVTWPDPAGACTPPRHDGGVRTGPVVLLEGVSDVAAVRAAAGVRGADLTGVRLVDLGGITNVRREMERLGREEPEREILGLCDVAEARFAMRAVEDGGGWVRDPSDLATYGFFVCDADLEEELIRALGERRVLEVIDAIGLGRKLSQLQQQPAWSDRPLAEQLHRFAGVASGRKELLAGALVDALGPTELPEPLAMLLDRIDASA